MYFFLIEDSCVIHPKLALFIYLFKTSMLLFSTEYDEIFLFGAFQNVFL